MTKEIREVMHTNIQNGVMPACFLGFDGFMV